MALSRRMTVPLFVVLLVVVVAAETATGRDVVDEKLCQTESREWKGACWSSDNCENICKKVEKFTSGECKMDGFERKCYCKKPC